MDEKDKLRKEKEADEIKIGKYKINLPITYKEADVFSAAFTVSARKLDVPILSARDKEPSLLQ